MSWSKKLFILVTFVLIIGLVAYYWNVLNKETVVKRGEVNLTQTDFFEKGYIELNGEWEFYWEELLTPENFKQQNQAIDYTIVPGNWSQDLHGNQYKNKGFATYRMVINEISNEKYFGFKKSNIRNASKIYINGEVVLEDGQVSPSMEDSVPGNNSEIIYFELQDETAEIIIHASNHEYIVGGIAKPLLFGLQQELVTHQQQTIMFEFAMLLVVFIVGIFYIILYFTSRHYRMMEPATFALALSCLCFGVTGGIYSERIITIIFPDLTLNSTFRFGHFVSALSVIFVLHVVNKINDGFLSNRLKTIISFTFALFILLVLTLPLSLYLSTLNFYLFFVVGVFLWISINVFLMYIKNQDKGIEQVEHNMLIVAIFSVFLFWFDLMLYSIGIKEDMGIAFFCMAIFSIALAALLIYRYTLYYKKSEELSKELLQTLDVLTEKSNQAKENELAFLQAQIKPHFLFNALNVISSMILKRSDEAYELVLSLSDYLRAKFDFYNKENWISIRDELGFIYSYLDIEQARFEERLKVDVRLDEDIDFVVPPLLIQPLVENAVRHGVNKKKEGGTVSIHITKLPEGHLIKVRDDGVGMSTEKVKDILDQTSHEDGIGLQNIQNRMHRLFGTGLQIESSVGEGTTISVIIPDRRV
ncbi:histidine kinase [Aquibacillus koreensis]|uniref:Histidine kinase n=1 Tax=Aquibacillus koreensis TaxID=279446 RepID=A0A9X3WM61_9BACI|nr:histidine kinase [Aquibacillus koreensis]MCT2537138.1 histidine kinase [Aquibacillus koreensis]MDC3419879.1 histidine kinase [Aquibacillus koreensis]